ncbi:hypothetical protein V8G54_000776 [Vigna mungo]|uniref:Uncharacterized protein n=1 Tax=Vigna mungo TaxID=3915 RepID=A0AAQ3S996_VIGMU
MLTLASLPFNICPCGPNTCRSKHWITDARSVAIPEVAKFTPGHILLPDPNGRSVKCWPLRSRGPASPSAPVSKNLSGRNSNGLSQYLGSLPTAHTLKSINAPSGITYPSISHSSTHFLFTTGSGGCMRNVSFTIALM